MKNKRYNYEFRVYNDGKPKYIVNHLKCTQEQAISLIHLFYLCKKDLLKGKDYFDYVRIT